MHFYGTPVSISEAAICAAAVALALAFQFVNGFHDTANAVTTVIYTNSMKPTTAVVWAGVCNLLGALFAAGLVGYAVVALLPPELVPAANLSTNAAMLASLLIPALAWNLGTWYFGLPVSSSQTLLGSILGVGFAEALLSKRSLIEGVDLGQVRQAGLTLLVSPVFGVVFAAALLLLAKLLIRNPSFDAPLPPGEAPPFWMRAVLVLSASGISFAHGSNDGQKGIGLVLVVLICTLPGAFAIDMTLGPAEAVALGRDTRTASAVIGRHVGFSATPADRAGVDGEFSALSGKVREIAGGFSNQKGVEGLAPDQRILLRRNIYLAESTIDRLLAQNAVADPAEAAILRTYRNRMQHVTRYVPVWVQIAVALTLALGTTVFWRRVAVTVGEKIGNSPLTPLEGASAGLVTAGAIAAANLYGIPASTTLVLTPAIAGAMIADRSGIQMRTLRTIFLVWVLTIPVTMLLSGLLFALAKAAGLD